MNGLLCCSTPGGYTADLNMSLPEMESTAAEWSAAWRTADHRTMEWVLASQRAAAMSADCRSKTTTAGGLAGGVYCGQDCGDGFCYNVWNSMVHV